MPARFNRKLFAQVSGFTGFLILSAYKVVPAFATSTSCPPNQTATDFGCVPHDVGGFTSKFYSIGLTFVGAAALLFIIYGGYLILTSQGNPTQFNRGKSYVFYSIMGLVFAVLAAFFLQFVVVDFLHIPGFGK